MTLEAAISALVAADDEAALEQLAAVWRATRAAELVPLIDQLAERVEGRVEPLRGRTMNDRYRAFMTTIAGAQQRDLGRLIALLPKLDWSDIKTALDELLYTWPHSPRIMTLLARYPAGERDRVLEICATHAQPRHHELTVQECVHVAELERLLARAEVSGEALLAAIYDNPRDDGPRSVYADWLQARGDLRGEFIALQLARRTGIGDAASERRERTLLAAHGREWLGPLASVMTAGSAVFERGFPSKVTVNRSDPFTAREWATVEAIALVPADRGFGTGVLGALARLPALAEVRGLAPDQFTFLATQTDLSHLGLASTGVPERSVLFVETRASLRSLGLYDHPARWTPLLQRATSLERIELGWSDLAPWQGEPLPAHVRELAVDYGELRLRLSRLSTGAFHRVVATASVKDITNHMPEMITGWDVRELELVMPRAMPTAPREKLERRLRREHPEIESITFVVA